MKFDVEELINWVDSYHLEKKIKFAHRDFADAVLLARILQKHYPRLVDLHNYPVASATKQRLSNWTQLNKKVLSKLHIGVDPDSIQGLAKAQPGFIDNVLDDVRQKLADDGILELSKSDDKVGPEEETKCEKQEISTYRQPGDPPPAEEPPRSEEIIEEEEEVEQPEDVYSSDDEASTSEKLKKKLEKKDADVRALKTKIRHYEHLLSVKDERIVNLMRTVDSLSKQDSGDDKFSNFAIKLVE